jgi:hypothetical protein
MFPTIKSHKEAGFWYSLQTVYDTCFVLGKDNKALSFLKKNGLSGKSVDAITKSVEQKHLKNVPRNWRSAGQKSPAFYATRILIAGVIRESHCMAAILSRMSPVHAF